MGVRGFVSLALVVCLVGAGIAPAFADAIVLGADRGPGPGNVSLHWSGGSPPYEIYRGPIAATTLEPTQILGTTSSGAWTDTPPAGSAAFYQVVSQGGGPFIASMTPPRASFGQRITVYGSGFGSSQAAVHVRFSYTDAPSGQSLTIDQPVLTVAPTKITLDVPLAVPNRINQVTVRVGVSGSPAVSYLVGALPNDPTPGVKGNETLAYLDKLDNLVSQFDARLDAWYVTSGVADPSQAYLFHQQTAQIRSAVATMRGDLAAMNPDQLAVSDVIVGTAALQDVLAKLQNGIDALHGSPLGTVMCEGTEVRDVVRDIVNVLNIVDDILSVVQTTVDAACAASAIATIFTLGAASPLAAFFCTIATVVNTVVQPVLDAIEATSTALDAIANAAPVDPRPGTYAVTMTHPLWGGDPPVVYVGGTIPATLTAAQDFENAACDPNGCDTHFSISIWGIGIPIDITIPHIVVPGLPLRCTLTSPDGTGGPGYVDLGAVNDGATCRFTGADVNGPSASNWVRGTYNLEVRSACGSTTLGPATFSKTLVSGPRLFSVTPSTAQLRDTIEMYGQYMPPAASGAPSKAQALYGDIGQSMIATEAEHYTLIVPDSDNTAGTVGLQVQGRDADRVLAFHVLPPVLTLARIDPGFIGEEVELHGTGFATDPSRNVLSLNGQTIPQANVVRSEPYGLVFSIPPGATSGPLQLVAATHPSNSLPYNILSWGTAPGVAVSNPSRNAYHPAVAAAFDDGTAGIVWIDRPAAGGDVRVLFTDASPTDSGFRSPIAIAPSVAGTEPAGPPSTPQAADVAVGADHHFHVAWATSVGAIRVASFAKGTTPAGSVVAISPTPGTVLRDPTIAVMADGSVHVAATRVPTNGGIHNVLLHARSTDGGATFGAAVAFMAPGAGTASDDLQLGEVDLTYANALLWRSWTQFHLYNDPQNGDSAQREVFTQSSSDGISWSAPLGAGAGLVDVPYSGIASSSRNAPSVSGDGTGAVVAWDAATTAPYSQNPGYVYSSRSVMVNSEPYTQSGLGLVTPAVVDVQTDVGHASLVHHTPGGSAMTAVASVRRIPGTSPDALPGVPRVHIRRFPLRDFINPTLFETTPTVAPGDATTVDDEPSLAVDGANHYHLAWLQGPPGHRVVRYQTTRTLNRPDATADNPPPVAAPARDVIAVNMGADYDYNLGESLFHWGVLLLDPAHPGETRWTGVSPVPNMSQFHGRPTFSPDGTQLLIQGPASLYGMCLASPDGATHVAAPDDPSLGVYGLAARFPVFSSDARIYALKFGYPQEFRYRLYRTEPGGGTFSEIANDVQVWGRYAVAPSGNRIAYRDSDGLPHVFDLTTEIEQPAGPPDQSSITLEWSKTSDLLAVVGTQYGHPCVADPLSECPQIFTFDPATNTTSAPLADAESIELQLAFKPGNSDLAYACRGLDCCATVTYPETAICTVGGLAVPHVAGAADRAPVWSPDGSAIAFIRVLDPINNPVGQLMLWHPGDPAATPLTGPVLGYAQIYDFVESTWTRIPQ